jgi:hypothetical protein
MSAVFQDLCPQAELQALPVGSRTVLFPDITQAAINKVEAVWTEDLKDETLYIHIFITSNLGYPITYMATVCEIV